MGSIGTSAQPSPQTSFEQLHLARQILRREAEAIQRLATDLDEPFCQAAELILACRGSTIVSGMGKAGLIGQKITATLASTGTKSHFLHPAEALHGDLGRLDHRDCLLMLSFSGETEEVVRLLPSLRQMSVDVVAMTGRVESQLARAAKIVLDLRVPQEACPLGLAPSSSTTAMLALGDALAFVVSQTRGFQPEDFARFHPGGSLGRKLSKVEDWMRPLEECRVSPQSRTVREVFVSASLPGRRTGAIMLTAEDGRLVGVFTDSDLAKLLESKQHDALDQPIANRMTREPVTVILDSRVTTAIELFSQRKISELPVVDEAGLPKGMIDITDIVHLLPPPQEGNAAEPLKHAVPTPTIPFPKLHAESPDE